MPARLLDDRRLIMIKIIPSKVVEKFHGCAAPLPLGIEGLGVLTVDLVAIVTQLQLWVRSEAVTGIDMTAEQVKVAREHCERVSSATRTQTSSLLKAGFVPLCTTSTSVLTGNTAGYIERLADSEIKS